MIERIVESAFQNRCLSVASEGFICQVLDDRTWEDADFAALQALLDAIERGDVRRESRGQVSPLLQRVSSWRSKSTSTSDS